MAVGAIPQGWELRLHDDQYIERQGRYGRERTHSYYLYNPRTRGTIMRLPDKSFGANWYIVKAAPPKNPSASWYNTREKVVKGSNLKKPSTTKPSADKPSGKDGPGLTSDIPKKTFYVEDSNGNWIPMDEDDPKVIFRKNYGWDYNWEKHRWEIPWTGPKGGKRNAPDDGTDPKPGSGKGRGT